MAEPARILVVDDEPAVQHALSRALTLERYEVALSGDGGDALQSIVNGSFDVVILDVSMPVLDGLEVCRRVRENGNRTPVLMLTAREQIDDRVAGLDAGADDYLARKGGKPSFRDAHTNGTHLRILTEALPHGYAVQLAQPLTAVDNVLSRLRLILSLLDVGGIALAALLGRLVAGAAVAPVKRLTQATEHVTRTQDLSERIESAGVDEIGRLAQSFNAMLDALQHSMSALDASVHAQRQLVADASHELRTPVTSLRTNIEILKQEHNMSVAERQRMLDDVVEQIEELTLLMNDLIELGRGEQPTTGVEDVRLDLIVKEAIDRAHRHSPNTPFELELDPIVLTGAPQRLGRAVNNLIDNAVNYSPPSSPVEIALHGNELTVRDHGPGISNTDLPHVFDRFYRGAEARGRPGSGLGLAIVRQVAEQHGGSVIAEAARGGGTLMRLRLPTAGPIEQLPTFETMLHTS
jgi:two-component system, OmpR family, sensor histidine kinase MprB